MRPFSEHDPAASPLSSAALRYHVRQRAVADDVGPEATRPFGLLGAVGVPTPQRRKSRYCPHRQVAVDEQGRPLMETMSKEWASKSSSDGDEGPEEDWGWEE
ncbi:putative ATP-grasp-modified RiPP [Saccharomonospora azurea]|uniref:putative ATP-grasp-modified RiPP n=1 Tax=Saccharomonospora azurea TaxID=40988 RepID=UPI003D9071AA